MGLVNWLRRFRKKLVLGSEEYKALEEENNALKQATEKSFHDQDLLLTKKSSLEQTIKGLFRKARESEEKRIELEGELERLSADPALNLGRDMLSDSSSEATLVFDRENKVMGANNTLCALLQVDRDDLIGDSLENLGSVSPYFNIYANAFGEIARGGLVELEPNRFSLKDSEGKKIVFDIRARRITRQGKYNGGYIILSPFEREGFLKGLRSSSTTFSPDFHLTKDNLSELYQPLMSKHFRHRYLDLANSSMTMEVMDSLFKFYQCMKNTEYTLTFKNSSREEADYLRWRGVDKKHIKGIRKTAKQEKEDTGEYPAIQGA